MFEKISKHALLWRYTHLYPRKSQHKKMQRSVQKQCSKYVKNTVTKSALISGLCIFSKLLENKNLYRLFSIAIDFINQWWPVNIFPTHLNWQFISFITYTMSVNPTFSHLISYIDLLRIEQNSSSKFLIPLQISITHYEEMNMKITMYFVLWTNMPMSFCNVLPFFLLMCDVMTLQTIYDRCDIAEDW